MDYICKTKGVLLAETYEKLKAKPEITGWWISEKLDGVRAYWNGKNFYSRNGLIFDAPEDFKKGLPKDCHLDGELWCGRDQFERCIKIVKYQKGSTAKEWRKLKFMAFDAPIIKGKQFLVYEKRLEYLKSIESSTPFAEMCTNIKCKGESHLFELLKKVTQVGGEGLMLREPGSLYERVRSKSLLKVKTFIDAEAKVIGYGPGKNRLQGMLGTLVCELPLTGVSFEVGTGFTDADRNMIGAKRRWPKGSVISFKYQNLTKKGKPRFPVFLRARLDKTWEECESDVQRDLDQKRRAKPVRFELPSILMGVACDASESVPADAIMDDSDEARKEQLVWNRPKRERSPEQNERPVAKRTRSSCADPTQTQSSTQSSSSSSSSSSSRSFKSSREDGKSRRYDPGSADQASREMSLSEVFVAVGQRAQGWAK